MCVTDSHLIELRCFLVAMAKGADTKTNPLRALEKIATGMALEIIDRMMGNRASEITDQMMVSTRTLGRGGSITDRMVHRHDKDSERNANETISVRKITIEGRKLELSVGS